MNLRSSYRPKKIHSQEELDALIKNDTYRRKKLVANAVTYVFIGLIVIFGVFVAYSLISDQQFREKVRTVIVDNLVGIVISGFVIIGFTFDKSKSGS